MPVPDRYAPLVTHGWGRTPVRATVDGITWDTSVWRGKNGETLLAVPKRVRGAKDHDDRVRVTISFSLERIPRTAGSGARHCAGHIPALH